jgi:hypothetical protein
MRRVKRSDEAWATIDAPGDAIAFRVARELRSVNAWQGRHWSIKNRERQGWEDALTHALCLASGAQSVGAMLFLMNAIPAAKRVCTTKRKVSIQRLAPSKRRFIRDDDNLAAASKPVLDALKRLAFIKDDRRQWIDLVVVPQDVSTDGRFWTVITVEKVA